MHTHTDRDWRLACQHPFLGPGFQTLQHRMGAGQTPFSRGVVRFGKSENCHDRIADKFVDYAPMVPNGLCQNGPEFSQQIGQLDGGECFRNGAESANIRKQNGDRLYRAAYLIVVRVICQTVSDICGKKSG